MRNRGDRCAHCGGTIFEVIELHHTGPYQGEPARIGKPLGDTFYLSLCLVDGITDVSVCAECRNPDLVVLWKNVMEAFIFDRERRKLPEDRAKQQDGELMKLFDNVPLGVIWEQKIG